MPEKAKSTKSKKAPASSPKTQKVTKQLPFRSKDTITSSDEEMLSSEDEAPAPVKQSAVVEESSSGEEEEEEEESSSSVVDQKKKKSSSKEITPISSMKSSEPPTPAYQPTGDYEPPESFKRISTKAAPSENPFSSKNLAGKEIWYITTPVDADVTALSEVNPVDVAEGNAVMEMGGRSYCLRPELDANSNGAGAGLLLPDSIGTYRAAKTPITKTFKIVETLPSKIRIPDNHTSKPKPVREQPQGLKQRFFPIGADIAPSIVDADMMDIDEPEPEAQEGSKKKKKHKSSHGADESGEKRKKKKSKKEAAA